MERRFKIRHDSIPLRLSSMNKKKAVEIFANSGESEEEKVYESDKPEENDSEKGNKVEYIIRGTPYVTQRMKCYTNTKEMEEIAKCLSLR